MVQNWLLKCKAWFLPREGEIIFVVALISIAIISFSLGRLSAINDRKAPIQVLGDRPTQTAEVLSSVKEKTEPKAKIDEKNALYVGSKNGSVYHFPWCPGAQKMKEGNKIFFSSKEEAEKAGYRPAANCDGL